MVLGYEGVLVRYFDYSKNFGVRSGRNHASWNNETGWTDKKFKRSISKPSKSCLPSFKKV